MLDLLGDRGKAGLEVGELLLDTAPMRFEQFPAVSDGSLTLSSQGGKVLHLADGHARGPEPCQELDPGGIGG